MTVNCKFECGNSYAEYEYLKWKSCHCFYSVKTLTKMYKIFHSIYMHSHKVYKYYVHILMKHIFCERNEILQFNTSNGSLPSIIF